MARKPKVVSPSTPYAYTIFCDDVRHEVSGKTTLVGVYNSVMILAQQAPIVVPRLWIVLNYFERPSESNEQVDVAIHVSGQDVPAVFATLVPAGDRPVPPENLPEAESETFIQFKAFFEIAPLFIEQFGLIKVRLKRGNLTIQAGSLLVGSMSTADELVPAPVAN